MPRNFSLRTLQEIEAYNKEYPDKALSGKWGPFWVMNGIEWPTAVAGRPHREEAVLTQLKGTVAVSRESPYPFVNRPGLMVVV